MDCSVFDTFLLVDTWHTCHPEDEKRFFLRLQRVVSNPDFNADQMADYMERTVKNPAFDHAISHYRAAAWAISDYLKVTS